MIKNRSRTLGLFLALTFLNPLVYLADEGLPAPQIHPLCKQAAEQKEIKQERVWSNWPDGSIKSKSIYFIDGTWVAIHFHQNGQMKLESYSTNVPREDNPKITINGKHGTEKRWYENGQLSSCGAYKMGKAIGTRMLYNRDGSPAAAWTYEDGVEVEHLTYSKVFGWQPFKS